MSTPDATSASPHQAAVDRENPWPGLGSYDESMHAFFFGRDAEVEELLRLVRRDPVALFYGQSGLGKSSLLQAGLFPRLRAADLMPVHIRLRFGSGFPHPVAQILHEVAAAARRAGGEAPAAAEGGSLFEYFYDEAHDFWSARNRVLTPVIVFDQFEEIFTLGARDAAASAHRDEVLAQLADLAARRAPDALVARFEHDPGLASRYALDRTRCRLLFSLREDFLPELGSLRDHLPTLPSGGLRLQRLRGHQAREVLEKPGAHLLEAGATERIIRFVAAERVSGEAHDLSELEVEPALLNVVARELNNRRRARGLERISADLVQGARNEILVDFYERAFTGLEPHVREFVEDQLLTTTGFRDSVAVEDAEASYRVSRDVLAVLVDRRLLRIDERFQMQRVELTHDLLSGVVKASRDSRREREAAAAARRRVDEAKRAAEQAAADAQARLRQTRTRVLVGTVMAVLAVGVGGLVYLNQRKAGEARRLDAERQAAIEARQAADAAREDARANLLRANEAMAGSLLLQSEVALTQGSFDTAQMLLRMGEDYGIFPEETLAWFAAALNQPRVLQLEATVRLAGDPVQVEFAPGGRLIAVHPDGTITARAITPSADGSALTPLPGALGASDAATAIDLLWGEPALIAIGTRHRAVHLFDLADGRLVRTMRLPTAEAAGVPRSEIAGDTKADTAATPTGSTKDAILRARFSADGRSLAAFTADGVVTTWQLGAESAWTPPVDGPEHPGDLATTDAAFPELDAARPESALASIAWAADGSLIVTSAATTVWLERPSSEPTYRTPIERFTNPALRSTIRPSSDGRGSEWFVANSTDGRLHWLRLPPDAAADSGASVVRTTEALPDTVHSIATLPGADVVFVAMRNGTIGTYRTALAGGQPALRVLQTAAAPRARHVDLRLRPDGRYLAAVSDDGTTCIYRVSVPDILRETPGQSCALVRDSAGEWRHIAAGGTKPDLDLSALITNERKALAIRISTSGEPPGTVVLVDAGGDFELHRLDADTVGTWRRVWQLNPASIRQSTDDRLVPAAFSPNGDTVAIGTTDGRIILLATVNGDEAAPAIPFAGEIQRLAWSGDGSRIAAANNLQEIAIFDLVAREQPALTVHARHSRMSGFALDGPGHTLAYATTDGRLVLERFAPGDRRASLMLPLAAEAGWLALDRLLPGPGVSIAAVQNERVQVFAGGLPSEPDLEWSNLAAIEGYQATPQTPTQSHTARLGAAWTDDSGNLTAAVLLRDTFAWIDAAASRFALAAGDLSPQEMERLRAAGDVLRQRFAALAATQPAFAALRDRLAGATSDLLAFSRELAPDMSPLDRWAIVTYQQSLTPDSDTAARFAVEHGLAAVVAACEKGASGYSESDRARFREIVQLASGSLDAETAISEARTLLRSELFTPEQWLELIFACPSAFLIDREANAQATDGAMDVSNRLYRELERREPAALTYPIRRGNNLRKMEQVDEALALFDRVAADAARARDGEVEAEARVYRAWTYQQMDGRLPDARADMIAAARLAPADAWTLRNAIEFLIENESPADAVEPAANLVATQASPANIILQARALLAAGDSTAARAAVASLAGAEDIKARLDIVELFGATPEHANRVFAAEWAYAAYQDTSDRALEDRALRNLGPLWLDTDDLVRARNALDKLLDYKLSLEEQAIVHAFQGRIDMRRRALEQARQQFETALRLDPEPSARIRRDYAHLLEWSGDATRALAQFRQAAEAGDADDALVFVEAAHRLDTPAAAARALDEALRRFPEDGMLRLARARSLLIGDPSAAQRDLTVLDDGSLRPGALMAAALLGRAHEAATRHLKSLDDSYAGQWTLQAQLEVMALAQTGDPELRLEALQSLSIAITRGFRGDVRLLALPGFDAVAEDPLFQLADTALATPADTRDGLFALARFNVRVAALIGRQEAKSALLTRAGETLRRGVDLEVFTPADVLADPELAPFAGQF